ncbi:MAG: DUF4334 domain-containing protein [Methylocystis sp.]|uniref:DUF4334 domain-containing protein n=1 Tax=Methylocystis sp. TaxID=1911079 RepID=UPI003DA4A82F
MTPTPMDIPPTNLARLNEIESSATAEAAMVLFDSLPAVQLDTMLGSWRGSDLKTGHPLEGMLESLGWHGKRFGGPEDVHPLVFEKSGGELFSVNPSMIPVSFIIRHARLFRKSGMARLLKNFVRILGTNKPKARLRMTEFRGVLTTTMIYDTLPINDIFRMVDQDTLVGVMDLRGANEPFMFVLRREGAG